MGFNQPSGGGVFFRPADHNGNLILITQVHSEDTRFDDLRNADVRDVVVDMVDLDSETPELIGGLIVSHKGLTKHLKLDSTMVLGRIGTAPTKKSDAYILRQFTPADAEQAEKWVEANKTRPTFTAPRAATVSEKPAPRASKVEDDPFATA